MGVLNALATVAQFSPLTPFESLNVMSLSDECAISIVANQSSTAQINYDLVAKALIIMIRDIMVDLKKFGEVTLRLEWERSAVAEMSVKSADHRPVAQQM